MVMCLGYLADRGCLSLELVPDSPLATGHMIIKATATDGNILRSTCEGRVHGPSRIYWQHWPTLSKSGNSIESPQASAGKIAYDGLAALGPMVAAHASVSHWSRDQRPTDDQGRHGALHAKCAVADATTMRISSANLTRYALALNRELGLLIRGGSQPTQVARHVDDLIPQGIVCQIAG